MGGGCLQEEEQEDPEVPESRGRRHPPGHHGQEEPEARGQEGPERAGSASCQESQEGRQQSRQERAEVCPQGWWEEINPDCRLLSSVVTDMSSIKIHQHRCISVI